MIWLPSEDWFYPSIYTDENAQTIVPLTFNFSCVTNIIESMIKFLVQDILQIILNILVWDKQERVSRMLFYYDAAYFHL